MNKPLQELATIENRFFEIDEETGIAKMKLHFSSPSELFEENTVTKIPVFTDDFLEWLDFALEYTPRKTKIALDIAFSDWGGYTEEEIQAIFRANMGLEIKRNLRGYSEKKNLAYSLFGIGIVFFLAMVLMSLFWKEGGILEEMIRYVADVATCVTFWEAIYILVVENKERRTKVKSLLKRFHSISFSRDSAELENAGK